MTEKPPTCLPRCERIYRRTFKDIKIWHDRDCQNGPCRECGLDEGHAPTCPMNAPKPAQERCQCGADDYNSRGRADLRANPLMPHALNCPKRPKEPSAAPGESIERALASAKARGWIGYEESMAFEIRLKQCAIASLRAAAARHSAEVADLREKLAERDKEIERLRFENEGYVTMGHVSADISRQKHQREREEYEAKLAKREAEVARLDHRFNVHVVEIIDLKAERDAALTDCAGLKVALLGTEANLDAALKRVEELREAIISAYEAGEDTAPLYERTIRARKEGKTE